MTCKVLHVFRESDSSSSSDLSVTSSVLSVSVETDDSPLSDLSVAGKISPSGDSDGSALSWNYTQSSLRTGLATGMNLAFSTKLLLSCSNISL